MNHQKTHQTNPMAPWERESRINSGTFLVLCHFLVLFSVFSFQFLQGSSVAALLAKCATGSAPTIRTGVQGFSNRAWISHQPPESKYSSEVPPRSNILVGSLGVKIFLQGPGQVVLQSNFPRSFTPDAILVEYMKRHKYSPTHLTSSDKTDVPSHFPRKSSTL